MALGWNLVISKINKLKLIRIRQFLFTWAIPEPINPPPITTTFFIPALTEIEEEKFLEKVLTTLLKFCMAPLAKNIAEEEVEREVYVVKEVKMIFLVLLTQTKTLKPTTILLFNSSPPIGWRDENLWMNNLYILARKLFEKQLFFLFKSYLSKIVIQSHKVTANIKTAGFLTFC